MGEIKKYHITGMISKLFKENQKMLKIVIKCENLSKIINATNSPNKTSEHDMTRTKSLLSEHIRKMTEIHENQRSYTNIFESNRTHPIVDEKCRKHSNHLSKGRSLVKLLKKANQV